MKYGFRYGAANYKSFISCLYHLCHLSVAVLVMEITTSVVSIFMIMNFYEIVLIEVLPLALYRINFSLQVFP